MSPPDITLQQLWDAAGFRPNPQQERAIFYTAGQLHLPAGPGSGKTRVLLWRTLNLIVFHHVGRARSVCRGQDQLGDVARGAPASG